MNKLSKHSWKNSSGFMATGIVILLALAGLAFAVTVSSAALFYADSVDAREIRIQKRLNIESCHQMTPLLQAKDLFIQNTVFLPEFDCNLDL